MLKPLYYKYFFLTQFTHMRNVRNGRYAYDRKDIPISIAICFLTWRNDKPSVV